ncbi:TATA-binding protein-interacting protein [Scheffersomyces amazonensis]|uniref:TATA-binding protein-interacting protein n=1 Tax=Scheffersomyces amazonensis TaxID=1078765 RepID=UPI00315D75D2
MSDQSIRTLKDKSLDVDPDLRFMALEDFRKFLTNFPAHTPNRAIESFIPDLFRLLKDEYSFVQNQAVKSFEPIIGFVGNDVLVKTISQLFDLAIDGSKSFTMSIPTMTLKSILNSSSLIERRIVCTLVIQEILPKLSGLSPSVDAIEIIVDLSKNLGYVLTEVEVYNSLKFVIQWIFNEKGIISKRAITAYGHLFQYIKHSDVKEQVLDAFDAYSNQLVKFQLYSIAFHNVTPVNKETIHNIFKQIVKALNLNDIVLDDEDDDFDFDELVQLNILREQSLTLIGDMIQELHDFRQDIFQIISSFLTFNPFKVDDDDDDDDAIDIDGDEDELEFDDDIDDANDDDNFNEDDNSWKLRLKACELLKLFIKTFPQGLPDVYEHLVILIPADDSNELVSNEALSAYETIINTLEGSENSTFEFIKNKIFNSFLIERRLNQLVSVFSVIKSTNRFHDSSMINGVFDKLNLLDVKARGSPEYFTFYENVLKHFNESGTLSTDTVNFIAGELLDSLDDKAFNVIHESIKILNELLGNQNSRIIASELQDKLKNALLQKILNTRSYSSDVIQHCIESLALLLTTLNPKDKDQEAIDVLWKGLENETITNASLTALVNIYSNDPNLSRNVSLTFLSSIILKDNEINYHLTLDLLALVIPGSTLGTNEAVDAILKRKGTLDVVRTFKVLKLVYEKDQISSNNLQAIINFGTELVNNGSVSIDNDSFFEFFGAVSKKNNIYYALPGILNLELEVAAKLLAISCVNSQVIDEIDKVQEAVLLRSNNLLFNIRFLGYIGRYVPLNKVRISDLFSILEDAHDESIKQALSVSIGLIANRDIPTGLVALLNHFSLGKSSNFIHLISSFRIILPECDQLQLESIWYKVWEATEKVEFDHAICSDLRAVGDLLGDIIVLDKRLIEPIVDKYYSDTTEVDNFTLAYTILVISKQLINKLNNSPDSLALLEKLIAISMTWTSLLSIDIRQLLVGNLLTALHSKPLIIMSQLETKILPQLYKQLQPEIKFKKIIPMGPSQYVLDEGLEIRKLIYEFFYTVLSLDDEVLKENSVDLNELGFNIASQGLVDAQNDVIVLSCTNLINFINNHGTSFLTLLSKDGAEVFNTIIKNLSIQLNKKLGDKASSQETETYQERIRAIIKLSKRIAQVIPTIVTQIGPDTENNWKKYLGDLQTKYSMYYINTDDS